MPVALKTLTDPERDIQQKARAAQLGVIDEAGVDAKGEADLTDSGHKETWFKAEADILASEIRVEGLESEQRLAKLEQEADELAKQEAAELADAERANPEQRGDESAPKRTLAEALKAMTSDIAIDFNITKAGNVVHLPGQGARVVETGDELGEHLAMETEQHRLLAAADEQFSEALTTLATGASSVAAGIGVSVAPLTRAMYEDVTLMKLAPVTVTPNANDRKYRRRLTIAGGGNSSQLWGTGIGQTVEGVAITETLPTWDFATAKGWSSKVLTGASNETIQDVEDSDVESEIAMDMQTGIGLDVSYQAANSGGGGATWDGWKNQVDQFKEGATTGAGPTWAETVDIEGMFRSGYKGRKDWIMSRAMKTHLRKLTFGTEYPVPILEMNPANPMETRLGGHLIHIDAGCGDIVTGIETTMMLGQFDKSRFRVVGGMKLLRSQEHGFAEDEIFWRATFRWDFVIIDKLAFVRFKVK